MIPSLNTMLLKFHANRMYIMTVKFVFCSARCTKQHENYFNDTEQGGTLQIISSLFLNDMLQVLTLLS